MNLFNKDPKQQEKRFYKQFWDFQDEKKQSQTTYVNKEMEMWKDDLQAKAEAFALKN
jgi:hypothetical protein